jgi:signal transduction histidine kinase/putative methionine-R-sulfoxide reductase with GAF domain
MSARTLLVVTGDYDVILQVKAALAGKRITVIPAFSHNDALHSVVNEHFDAALVDAAIFNRSTGESTLIALRGIHECPPLIAYVSDALSEINARRAVEPKHILTTLDQRQVRQMLNSVLYSIQHITGVLPTPLPERIITKSGSWDDEEIQTLLSLSRSLNEVLDLSEVLNRVVEAARRLTRADEGMILMPDGEGTELYLRARVGMDIEKARNFRIKTSDTVAGDVFANGKPALLGDGNSALKVKTEYLVNSLLYVPIVSKRQTIGVLGVNNRHTTALFNQRHQELLTNLASYAAVAIENARVHEQSVRRARELKALVDAGRVINASLSLEVMLPNICNQFVSVLNTNYGAIYEWLPDNRQLRLLAQSNEALWPSGSEPVIKADQDAIAAAALEGRRAFIIQADEMGGEDVRKHGVNAMCVIPITGGEQVYGLVRAYYLQQPPETLTAEFVSRAGRLGLDLLMNLTDRPAARIFKAAREIIALLKADGCDFALVAGDERTLKVHVSIGSSLWLYTPSMAINLDATPDIAKTIETGIPINHHLSMPPSPGAKILLQLSGTRSVLALPLTYRGKTQGLVVFGDATELRCFEEREIELGRAIVGLAATAIDNAQLLHDLEMSLAELKATQDRLIQTERLSAMGELAAAVAHQVNNPLATIVMDSELLLSNAAPGSLEYDSLSAIFRAGKRAAGVVRRLLAGVRVDSAAVEEPIEVLRTIDDTVALVRSHIKREQMKLYWKPPSIPLPPVLARTGELDDVWLNLLMNSHDALVGQPGAELGIQVDYTPGQDWLEVSVWDNGPGIPENIQKEIFKPFFTTKPVGEGTGLGLHICRQIVESAGGVIELHSRMNEGTQFIVRLPIIRSKS